MTLKKLIEKKNTLLEERDAIVAQVETEVRALENEEMNRLETIKSEVRALDMTIAELDEQRDFQVSPLTATEKEEEKRFLDFCKGEERGLGTGANGAIIPTHVAQRIVDKVKEISPIYGLATKFNVNGDLVFPVYEEGIKAAYVEDLTIMYPIRWTRQEEGIA
jgi:HK97 family phage major capsid protein